ncbi:proteasome subunit beta [Candidatus Bathyarchaeota archaeon RBG_16_48_13]|nr:MAG: proteasome subunit beta [Candidatus Bathyarchaeota archaeon RBG_16_48_13]
MPGATTIGLLFKEGVILASERRVSYGYFIMSKSGRKVFKLTDNVGAACAGLISDMQVLIREVSAYSSLYILEHNRPMSVKSVAKLMSSLLFERRLYPMLTQTIIGGVDEGGPSLHVLDPLGSVIPDKFACVGSGAEIAIGMLEADYKDNMSLKEARDLVMRSLKSAVARDIASGEGADILVITNNGIEEESAPIK